MSYKSSDIGVMTLEEVPIETGLNLPPVASKPYTIPLKHQEFVRGAVEAATSRADHKEYQPICIAMFGSFYEVYRSKL